MGIGCTKAVEEGYGKQPFNVYKMRGRLASKKRFLEDAQEFLKRFNQIESSDNYRLPAEAEWEYACRAGSTTRY